MSFSTNEQTADPPADSLRIGKCLGPHGLRGAVKLFVIGDTKQLSQLTQVYLKGRGWLRLLKLEHASNSPAMLLAGIGSREAALELRDVPVYAKESELLPLEQGSYYYHQLRGLKLLDTTGHELAKIIDVLDGGHQDLLVVQNNYGQSLVPLQAPYVQVVNTNDSQLSHLQLSAEAPEGLLAIAKLPDKATE